MAKNTTHEFPVYIAERTIEDIGRQGGTSIGVYVHGFWSDVITIYVRRDWMLKYRDSSVPELKLWTFEISHSSGGRDTDDEPCDIKAHDYFAMGIAAACQHARILKSQVEQLEKAYQAQCAKDTAAREVEQAAAQARVEADAPLGVVVATTLVTTLAAHAKASRCHRDTEFVIPAYVRGEEEPSSTKYFAKRGRDDVVRFFIGGAVTSKAAFIEKLAALSHRTTSIL